MKIIELHAENVKRLKVIDITPDGNIQIIGGRNSQGKSSVLDAIFLALGGGDASKQISKPVRDGETSAEVVLTLDDYIITRTWKGDKTELKVTSKDGGKHSSPQTILNGLLGRLTFDPLEFTRLDSRKQLEALLDLVDLDIDLKALEANRAKVYEDRTEIGRTVNALEGQLQGLGKVEKAPDELVVVSELIAEHERVSGLRRRKFNLEEEITTMLGEIKKLSSEVDRKSQELRLIGDELPNPDEIKAQINDAEEINNKVRRNQRRAEVAGKLKSASDEREIKTSIIQDYDNDKSMALAKAKFPVPGLGFTDEGVTFNGIPFDQASDSEKIRVSFGMAMALNPKLRVTCIRDGSLLDQDSLKLISDMAIESDYQIWIERVGNADESAIIIEDGAVI